jgi:hypothetical protein
MGYGILATPSRFLLAPRIMLLFKHLNTIFLSTDINSEMSVMGRRLPGRFHSLNDRKQDIVFKNSGGPRLHSIIPGNTARESIIKVDFQWKQPKQRTLVHSLFLVAEFFQHNKYT